MTCRIGPILLLSLFLLVSLVHSQVISLNPDLNIQRQLDEGRFKLVGGQGNPLNPKLGPGLSGTKIDGTELDNTVDDHTIEPDLLE
ncbi:uncharacterized protein VTP21DRAFT_11187 [Calcarisporiella thermophila]|uniref:uncharacterized protein n=1 Tax=Calcarisporiella thermophila TaxID=911321 RepID=UPI0037428F2A